jgi:murein DD-endopeptidase MepM/ murein hydrolase activator NlpD
MVTIRGHFSLSQHRTSHPRTGAAVERARRDLREYSRNEVTEILPLDGFSDLDDPNDLDFGDLEGLDFDDDTTFDNESQVLLAPELDDLNDVDDLTPIRLVAPAEVHVRITSRPDIDTLLDRFVAADVTAPLSRVGQHRKQPTSASKGRLLIASMAAGAAAAAAHSATSQADTPKTETVLTANASSMIGGAGSNPTRGAQIISVQPAASVATHNEEAAKGAAYAQERAQREARLQQPLYVMPTKGIFTSNFGYRWGVLHAGIDLANSIGTPIYAVSDGVVIDAGPTAGYGMWVKLRHADGTVTLYGHINSALVGVGDRVMAGDQIATMGNRGNSTGPHLHFEVLLGGSQRIDPVPWLAKRGLSVGSYAG